jgi:hypothetical protein
MRKHTESLRPLAPAKPLARAGLARTRTLQRGAIVSPPAISTMRGPAYLAVKAVGTFVPKLTQKAFEKYGFSTATLLTDWVRIVGHDLGRDTRPERLKWPRSPSGDSAGADTGRGGATLVLRVDPARALDISYKEQQVIERINTYFGYGAISELRIVQAPITDSPSNPPKQAHRVPVEPGRSAVPIAKDDPLLQALARLEAGVLGRK